MTKMIELEAPQRTVELDWDRRYDIACSNIEQLANAAKTEYVRHSDVAKFIARQLNFVHAQAAEVEQEWVHDLVTAKMAGGADANETN